jgi:hypothetical protein
MDLLRLFRRRGVLYRYAYYGDEFGVEWDLPRVGDEIPTHTHPPGEGHSIRCLRGGVRVEFPGVKILLKLGQPPIGAHFVYTHPHSVTAMEPNSAVFNHLEFPPPDHEAMMRGGWHAADE